MPSGRGRITGRLELLDQPIATAEFLVVDTETNGLGGDDCELTEVGAVLVGGGELHDRWSSLVRTSTPLRRGIQRFTGITQAMVDAAPPLEEVLPAAEARLGAGCWSPTTRRSTGESCARRSSGAGLAWPDPPVLCTAALARALLPLQRERGSAPLADALGIEVRRAPRACRRRDVRAGALRAVPAPVRQRRHGRRRACPARAAPARSRRARPGAAPATRADRCGRSSDFARAAPRPGRVHVPRRCRAVLYVGKSISIRSRARAHFAPRVRRRRAGPRHARSSTTSRRAPSSARWCSRTG